MSVDGIILWLLTWLVNYVAMLLVVCQLSRDVIGYEDSLCNWCLLIRLLLVKLSVVQSFSCSQFCLISLISRLYGAANCWLRFRFILMIIHLLHSLNVLKAYTLFQNHIRTVRLKSAVWLIKKFSSKFPVSNDVTHAHYCKHYQEAKLLEEARTHGCNRLYLVVMAFILCDSFETSFNNSCCDAVWCHQRMRLT